MKKRSIYIAILFFLPGWIVAQHNSCNLAQSSYSSLYTVVPEDVRCIAKNSNKTVTIFYTFAAWCSPCLKHLPEAILLSKEQDADFYLLLMDRENYSDVKNAINAAKKKSPEENLKMVIISDSLFSPKNRYKKEKIINIGSGIQEKYSNFVTAITPPQFENIADMSKYIVLNKQGEVIFISNYKDSENTKDKSKVIEKIVMVIEQNEGTR